MLDNSNVLVSVCVVTYNQEKYIRQCLQSLVQQETTFKFEVIVADDRSTDQTRAIVDEFSLKYPGIIRPFFQERNVGPSKNYVLAHKKAVGKYVAHMDGDDYALPGKLQKQADFLDQNASCSVVCHRTDIINEAGDQILGQKPPGHHAVFTDIDGLVAEQCFFDNSSKMYRRSANIFDHSKHEVLIDFFVHVEHASQGQIGFIGETLGCHRVNSLGITAGTGEKLYALFDATLLGFERARELGVQGNVVDQAKSKYLLGAASLCLSRGDVAGYKRYIGSSRVNGRCSSLAHYLLFFFRDWVPLIKLAFLARTHGGRLIRRLG
jgi:glycosyltransferase involved in cell wall biosynthesis